MSVAAARMLKILGSHMERRIPNIAPEYGTVLSIDPLIIQLDLDANIQLSYDDGDFTLNDQLVLDIDDHVVMSQILSKHQYTVMYRVGGKPGVAVHGNRLLAQGVIRVGDVTGPASAGTAHTHDHLIGSEKVQVE